MVCFTHKLMNYILNIEFYLGHPKQPKEPLIRLRIEYTCETQHFNGIQFGQQFQDRVANFSDMILLRMEKKSYEKKSKCIDDDALANIMVDEEVLAALLNVYLYEFNL